MKRAVIIHIKENATGETVSYEEKTKLDDDTINYQWSDGNYGCDCNL